MRCSAVERAEREATERLERESAIARVEDGNGNREAIYVGKRFEHPTAGGAT